MLFLGDCLEIMAEIPEESVDMVLADPPYGTTACKWDTIIPLPEMWAHLKRICKPNAAIVMTASQPFTSALGASNLPDLRYSWAWEKHRPVGHLNAKRMPLKGFEDILVFYCKQPTYHPQGTVACYKTAKRGGNGDCYGVSGKENIQTTTGYPRGIIKFPHDKGGLHPTQKPVALMEYLIRTYTNEDETVLDFAMGSGTTGVACKNLNREFVGIELDRTYFDIARDRIYKGEKEWE